MKTIITIEIIIGTMAGIATVLGLMGTAISLRIQSFTGIRHSIVTGITGFSVLLVMGILAIILEICLGL